MILLRPWLELSALEFWCVQATWMAAARARAIALREIRPLGTRQFADFVMAN